MPTQRSSSAATRTTTPRWFVVDLVARRRLPRVVTLEELKAQPALRAMGVVQRGSRLSVQPVARAEFELVLELAKRPPAAAR